MNWLVDTYTEVGIATAYETTGILHEEQSVYQHIKVYSSTQFGHILTLDHIIQLTARDNFFYHEMLAHPAIYKHKNPQHIAIIGGGDCGVLHEVLKHNDIEKITQIELDARVTTVSAIYFPELCISNTDPRAELIFADGIVWMQQAQAQSLDIIIVDSTDPIGAAEELFGKAFYQQCYRVLKPGGIIVHQSESPLTHLTMIQQMQQKMREAGFTECQTLHFPAPCYPTGWWTCTLASKDHDLNYYRREAADRQDFTTQYYNANTHQACGLLPPYLSKGLTKKNTG